MHAVERLLKSNEVDVQVSLHCSMMFLRRNIWSVHPLPFLMSILSTAAGIRCIFIFISPFCTQCRIGCEHKISILACFSLAVSKLLQQNLFLSVSAILRHVSNSVCLYSFFLVVTNSVQFCLHGKDLYLSPFPISNHICSWRHPCPFMEFYITYYLRSKYLQNSSRASVMENMVPVSVPLANLPTLDAALCSSKISYSGQTGVWFLFSFYNLKVLLFSLCLILWYLFYLPYLSGEREENVCCKTWIHLKQFCVEII